MDGHAAGNALGEVRFKCVPAGLGSGAEWRRGRIEGKFPDSIEPPPVYVDFVEYVNAYVAAVPRPRSGVAFLSGICGNIVGKIGDEEWEALMRYSEIACGRVDCNCERTSEPVFTGLDAARKEWRLMMLEQ